MNAIAARFTIAVGRRTGDRAIGHRLINRQSPGTPRSAAAAVVVMCVVIVLGSSAATLACKVPVFRYALERWEPAPYRVVVLTADAAAAESLALPALAGRPGRDRRLAEVRVVDAARPLEVPLAAAWAAHGGPDTPVVWCGIQIRPVSAAASPTPDRSATTGGRCSRRRPPATRWHDSSPPAVRRCGSSWRAAMPRPMRPPAG